MTQRDPFSVITAFFIGQQQADVTDESSMRRMHDHLSNDKQHVEIKQGTQSVVSDSSLDIRNKDDFQRSECDQEDLKMEVVATWYSASEEDWTCQPESDTGHEHPVVGKEYVGEQENKVQCLRYAVSDTVSLQSIDDGLSNQQDNTDNSIPLSDKTVVHSGKNDLAGNKDITHGIEDCSSKNTERAPRFTKKSNRKRDIQDSKNRRSGKKGTSLRANDKRRSEASQIMKNSTKIGRKIQTKSVVCMKVKRRLSSSIRPLISSIKPKQKTVSSNSIKEMPLRRRSIPLKYKEFRLNSMRRKQDNNDKMTKTNKNSTQVQTDKMSKTNQNSTQVQTDKMSKRNQNSTQVQTDNKSANSSKKLQVLQNYPKVFEICVPVVKLSKSQIDKLTGLRSPIKKLESNFSNKDQNVSFRSSKIQATQTEWKRKFKKKHVRLKVVDSDFWNIPLNAFEGKIEYPEHFADKVSSYFSYLLGTDIWSAIPEKFVQTASLFSNSNRTRFAMSLFQSILSIRDVFQENAEGFVVDKIESWKMNLVREVTFKYFPADYRCEDNEWKWITAYLVHILIHSALGCVEKWFDISAIKDKQQQ